MMSFNKSVHNASWGSEGWEISAYPSDPSVVDLARAWVKGKMKRQVKVGGGTC